MQKASLHTDTKKGSTLVEALLAVATFGLFVTAIVGGLVYGRESTALAGQRQRAAHLTEECQEAVRGIRDGNYASLANGTYGLVLTGGHWTLSGTSDVTDSVFTRTVTIADGVSDQKSITCNVNWNQNLQRTGALSTVSYLTNWLKSVVTGKKGMLVYGDGGTTSDAIKYQIYDDAAGTWSTAAATADVDGATATKYLRRAELYASPTRDEKVLLTRHYNTTGTTQWIYAQVYNGTTGTWGNVNQLSTWTASTYLDVKNFGGTYLANGNFVTVYSDNTTIPKFKVWNGTAWSTASGVAGTATPTIGGIPTYITVKQRPGTNEAMAVFSDQTADTNSLYFWIGVNGTYETADWVLSTEHSAVAPSATKKMTDFSWSSSDPTKGALVYTDNANDKAMNIRIWTANGAGSGSWNTTAQYGTAQVSNIGALSITPIKGSANFLACNKDALATPLYICMRATTAGWVATSSATVSAATDAGIQISYAMDSEQTSAANVVSIYSDNTTTAKYKKFAVGTNTWDAAPTNINATAVGVIKSAMAAANPVTDDIMMFVADANLDLFSVIFDGTNNNLFSTPAGKAWLTHGANGSATTDFWYDFAWDSF